MELCKISANLQTPTVRLLADLPSGQLGPWAATGWEKIFTGAEANREFTKIKEAWAKLDENKPLQLAAGGGRSFRGKGAR